MNVKLTGELMRTRRMSTSVDPRVGKLVTCWRFSAQKNPRNKIKQGSVTQQRSTGSKTRLSCSHVHEKNTHPCKQGFEKKGPKQTVAENMENSGDKTDRATMRSTTHTPQLCLHADQKRDKTVEFLSKEPRIPENMVGTKNTNNCKTRISSTPAEHDRGLFIQFATKTSRSLAK